MVKIIGVEKKSLAEKAGVREGDVLVSINGKEIADVLDYRFRLCEKKVVLSLLRDGKSVTVKIKKGENDDVGLEFETPLMDKKQSCRNKCIFCFIDQNPGGMRESCYFKDDDSRLSFLHGNYITMTNLSEHEIERIIEMHISPLNISVHTTNPELRCKMLNNRFAGEVLGLLERFAKAGIKICAQIVLCRGINDGAELERTMHDLAALHPALESVSIVPAGLTKHRDGLYPLSLFTPEECRAVVGQVTAFGDACLDFYGSRLFWCSDEFYVRGGVALPPEEYYEDFSQLENGVGMLPLFEAEANAELDFAKEDKPENRRTLSVATGYAAYDMICRICRRTESVCKGLKINVLRIRNDFFGESVTVSGLLTGNDIAAQVLEAKNSGTDIGEALLIPRNALRADGDLFLDGTSPGELSQMIGVGVATTACDGGEFVRALLNEN